MRGAAGPLVAVLLFAAPSISIAAVQANDNHLPACRARRDEIRGALRHVHERQRNVGLAATVLLDGKVVLSEGLGFADLDLGVPVTRDTRFGLASITKTFTGVALLKLREAGRIDLDAPIQRYVPAFPVKPAGAITPRLLAANLAGLRHWGPERNATLYARHFDDVNEILPLFKDDTLIAVPGTTWTYSSYGYNLLGVAIENASGVKYQDYVAREILTPLGLTNIEYDDVRRVLPNRARRYTFFDVWTGEVDSSAVRRVPDWDYSHNMAGGNLYATADDLARFGRALMRPGLLTQASLDLLYTRPRIGAVTSDMSFGVFVKEPGAGPRRIRMDGSNAGVQSSLYVYPDDDLVIVVLANTRGLDSGSGDMVWALPERMAAICMGWAPAPATAQ